MAVFPLQAAALCPSHALAPSLAFGEQSGTAPHLTDEIRTHWNRARPGRQTWGAALPPGLLVGAVSLFSITGPAPGRQVAAVQVAPVIPGGVESLSSQSLLPSSQTCESGDPVASEARSCR